MNISPTPTAEEVAAIAAALDTVGSRPLQAGPPRAGDEPSRWRFAGRWWSKPVPARRDRPW